ARIVAQAQGDAQRFKSVLSEYQKAPQVTRDRLYLETMQQIYGNVTKVLIDSRQGANLLYLPLDKLMQQSQTGADSTAPATSTVPTGSSVPPVTSSTDARSRDPARARERDTR
ncbi:MAG: protease modulator HflK, partial [Betaproteobacteria bacterium]